MSRRRVVLTGLGIVSPIGNSVAQAWQAALAGTGGITRITRFDASRLASQIAGEVKNFDVAPYMSPKEARRMDLFIHYGMAAGLQAWRDCGLQVTPENAERIGVNYGSGMGGLPLIETMHEELKKSGPRRISPFFIPGSIINMVAGLLSIELGAKGPNLAIVTACTTSTHCIGEATKSIRYGEADVMIAGGAEAVVTELSIGGFAAARALSTRNDDPASASRPWDRDRDGFVLGEGAGAVVLEDYEHAKARGARIYAEVLGYGVSADAHHMTAPPEDGDGGYRAMRNALKDAALASDTIDYINAHGTSTPLGDLAETVAIKRLLGSRAHQVAVNSTKSMTGHLLGAAGAVEAVFTALALRDQVSPPTINLRTPDPACDLDYVPNSARRMPIKVALSNSFGFGGTNGTLVLGRA
ncbi:MAG TPA: beta-ketoacyl-ACP synthase II [Burkholderiales bacterium]|nr:beta-ketoacyl-ACP synthase II [Burkholderiales bacterium]